MTPEEIRKRLDEQGWQCCYPCAGDGTGEVIEPGDPLALAFDRHGIAHLPCVRIGYAPYAPTQESA